MNSSATQASVAAPPIDPPKDAFARLTVLGWRWGLAAIVAGQRNAQILDAAAKRTASPSDHLAYDLDAWLVCHPEAPLSKDADYPGFAEYIAARQADNRKARNALKETSS